MISRMPLLYLCAQRVRGAVAEPVLVPEKAQVQAAQVTETASERRLVLKQERRLKLRLESESEPAVVEVQAFW
jgi:hypothetical protein